MKKLNRLHPHNYSLIPAYVLCLFWTAFTTCILVYIVAASLSTSREIFKGEVFQFASGFHFENYVTAWKAQNLARYFLNTLIYASVTCVGALLVAAPAAYVLSRYQFVGNALIRRCLVLAMSIPSILIVLPIYGYLIRLNFRGIIPLCLVYICMRVPFSTIFLMNFFESISITYEEAAALDGCPNHKIFTKIMLPMVRPAIVTISLFNFLNILNEYFIALILVTDKEATSLGVGLSQVINAMKYTGNYPAIFAAVVIVMLPSILLFVVGSKRIMYGNMGGGIKG